MVTGEELMSRRRTRIIGENWVDRGELASQGENGDHRGRVIVILGISLSQGENWDHRGRIIVIGGEVGSKKEKQGQK